MPCVQFPLLKIPQVIFVFLAEHQLLHSLNTYTVPPPCQANDVQRQDTLDLSLCTQLPLQRSHFLTQQRLTIWSENFVLISKTQDCGQRVCNVGGLQPPILRLGALRHSLTDTICWARESHCVLNSPRLVVW